MSNVLVLMSLTARCPQGLSVIRGYELANKLRAAATRQRVDKEALCEGYMG